VGIPAGILQNHIPGNSANSQEYGFRKIPGIPSGLEGNAGMLVKCRGGQYFKYKYLKYVF